jgi:ribosomal protein S12 methylthiotransferase
VTGCLAERYRDELRDQIPEIDAVLGTGQVPEIVAAIGEDQGSGIRDQGSGVRTYSMSLLRSNGEPVALRSLTPDPRSLPTYIYDANTPRLLATPPHYAYLKIAEGCDYKCAFCIIPTLRGQYRSRASESILDEAGRLATRGVKELLLISQDTTFYGIDQGERGALPSLLRALSRIEGLEWIRMLYLYPTTITDEVIDAIGESAKVCRYVDLPLQHASDAVLRRMKRPGTRSAYVKLLERIRRRLPGVALRTTFIVGFPGETEADFEELKNFVREVEFDHLGVFTYSHEEGTHAWSLPDDISPRVKRERQAKLMSCQKTIVAGAQRARIGKRVRLLIDGPSAEHELVLRGRLDSQAPDIDPMVYLSECDPSTVAPGTFINAEITGSRDYDLIARPASAGSGALSVTDTA